MDMTRRNFVGALAATFAIPTVGVAFPKDKKEDWFQDLVVDRYYVYQGGEYKDTGGWGCPYPEMMNELMRFFKHHDHCRDLEDKAEAMEKMGYYLSQSQYLGKPYCQYNKIPLTKEWVMEFYRRHKDETPDDWQRRYDEHYNMLFASNRKPGMIILKLF